MMNLYSKYYPIILVISIFCSCTPELEPIPDSALTNKIEISDITVAEIYASYATLVFKIPDTFDKVLSEHGICFSNTNKLPVINTDNTVNLGKLEKGSEQINAVLRNLQSSTTYYARAFFIYEESVIYSPVRTFTTEQGITITTPSISNIGSSGATVTFGINDISGISLSDHGICYSSFNTTPTVSNDHISLGNLFNSSSTINAFLSNLAANTTYYLRAYYVHEGTYYYSSAEEFTTATTNVDVKTLIYSDYFTSASSSTWLYKDEYDSDNNYLSAYVSEGYYNLAYYSPNYFNTAYDVNGYGLYDYTKEFIFETSVVVNYVANAPTFGSDIGISIGTSNDYRIIFTVTSGSYFYVGTYSNSNWENWTSYTHSSNIYTDGTFNLLTVERDGTDLIFSVNNVVVHTQHDVTSIPNGFALYYYSGSFTVDHVEIYQ